MLNRVITGLSVFLKGDTNPISGQRLGLLCNPASINEKLVHARHLIHQKFPGRLRALFSPQHGFFAEKQDNMIESLHMKDAELGIPIYSLYGKTRIPSEEMFSEIDTLLIDLQDVGTRVYTFMYTVSYCMEMAKKRDKKVIILDRPNPVGGVFTEGNLLQDGMQSFVGRYPIPMRHGLTMGELAILFNEAFGIGCDLEVIAMQGWQRHMLFRDTGLPWVAPSPNLPTPESALVYPGQVIWEGTQVSEGRGTTQPFELCGAPFIEPEKVLRQKELQSLAGVVLRPVVFEPTSGKQSGTPCRGFQLHVTDVIAYRPYRTSLQLLQTFLNLYPDQFQWKEPPYEYEYHKKPIDLILGDREIRQKLEKDVALAKLEAGWQDDLENYNQIIKEIMLYL